MVFFFELLLKLKKRYQINNSSLVSNILNSQIGLPNYHPKFLIDLLMFNKFEIVEYVKLIIIIIRY
jgi:hypothetical protein